jgi:single-strand DNA-binding protein
MITATAIGFIGRDAETKNAGSGTATNFSLASEARRKGEKETTWVKVTMWGKRGESLCQHLTKGSRVAVSGELRQFEDREGKRHLELSADQVELLGGGQRAGAGGPQRQAPRRSQSDPEDDDPTALEGLF